MIVDGGAFDFENSGRFPGFTEPDPSYHGLIFGELPDAALPGAIRLESAPSVPARPRSGGRPSQLVPLPPGTRDPEPADGAPCRQRHDVANWLESRSDVTWVTYPGLESSPVERATAEVSPQGRRRDHRLWHQGWGRRRPAFHRRPRLFSHLANVGDVRSLAIHPASTTHSQLSESRAALDRRQPRPCSSLGGY